MYKYFNSTTDPLIIGLDSKLLRMLDVARGLAGIPFIITSGKRTEAQNNEAAGVSDSAHLKGLAVDLRCENDEQRFRIVTGLISAGFARIELAKDHIHTDIDNSKPYGVMWL